MVDSCLVVFVLMIVLFIICVVDSGKLICEVDRIIVVFVFCVVNFWGGFILMICMFIVWMIC